MAKISDALSRQNEAKTLIQRALDTAKQCMKQEEPLSQEIIKTYNYLVNGIQPGLQAKDSNTIKPFSELPEHDEEKGEGGEEVTDFTYMTGENSSDLKTKARELALDANATSSLESKEGKESTQSVDYAKILASRNRASSAGVKNLSALRTLKSLIVPLIGAVAVVALLVFILCRPKATEAVLQPKAEPKSAIQKRFLTADLAGFAQTMYLSTGEYPQLVTSNIINQFTFENPVTKQLLSIPIKVLTANSFVGVDPQTALASGVIGIDEKKPQPCGIACYTQVASVMDARGEKLKTVKFFLRGYDKNGQLLRSSINNQVYVECASSLSLIDIAEQESKTKQKKKTTIKAPENPLTVEPPPKPTSLWLVTNPSISTIWVHYALPLTLLSTSILAFMASHLQGVNIKGQTVSSGSRIALYFSVTALLLALLSIARIYLLS
ncbi:MAG: hypothetical protein IPJ49_23545 [Candidatus Obscuribacter sp.]|nr:hypothetical protein [Candidatus Obscuribacter sp.]